MFTEEMLKQAAEEANQVLLNDLPEDIQFQHTFSADFEKQMRKLDRKTKHIVFHRVLKGVASILLVLCVGMSAILVVDVEAREKVFGWIRQELGIASLYQYSGKNQEKIESNYQIGNIPEGYYEIIREMTETDGMVTYVNAEGQYLDFSYLCNSDDTTLLVGSTDGEKPDVKTLMIGKYQADYYQYSDTKQANALVWVDEEKGVLFYISGFFAEQEFIDLAVSIEAY